MSWYSKVAEIWCTRSAVATSRIDRLPVVRIVRVLLSLCLPLPVAPLPLSLSTPSVLLLLVVLLTELLLIVTKILLRKPLLLWHLLLLLRLEAHLIAVLESHLLRHLHWHRHTHWHSHRPHRCVLEHLHLLYKVLLHLRGGIGRLTHGFRCGGRLDVCRRLLALL